MRVVSLFLALAALAACGSAPCEGYCRIECQNVVVCEGGGKPDEDSCVQSCTDFVQKKGVTSDSQCACSGASCSTEPTSLWMQQYRC